MDIYLDYCATTPMRPQVAEAMRPWLGPAANPASPHGPGRAARRALEESRELIAERLGAAAEEVVFTSGATEANNLAIFGLAGEPPGHIITSPIEHPCVREPIDQLRKRGFAVDLIPIGNDGIINADAALPLMKSDTCLISLQLVNHETGAIAEGIDQLSKHTVHTDAAQAVGKTPIDFHKLGVAALTLSGHKIHGPVGVGALLLRRYTKLAPLLFGGQQQLGKRPGTESVPLAVGLAAAVDLSIRTLSETTAHLHRLRQRMIDQLPAPFSINGPSLGSPHVLNVSFPGCGSELLVINLDLAGVAVSAGAACASGSMLPSPVLTAMGLPEDRVRSAIRMSFGVTTPMDEIEEAVRRIRDVVERLRRKPVAGGSRL